MLLDLSANKSTLVQVMAWCRQATSHYLRQCWPRSVLPYGVTRPQWVTNNTVQYSILHSFCKSRTVIRLWTQNTPHFSPSHVRYGVYIISVLEEINCFNSLWPSEARWDRTGWVVAQVMPCCLAAPSTIEQDLWLWHHTDQVMEVWLSRCLVLLSTDSKTR